MVERRHMNFSSLPSLALFSQAIHGVESCTAKPQPALDAHIQSIRKSARQRAAWELLWEFNWQGKQTTMFDSSWRSSTSTKIA